MQQGRKGCAAREEPVPSTALLGKGQGHRELATSYSTSPSEVEGPWWPPCGPP